MDFRPTTPSDHAAIAELLTRVFQLPPDNPSCSRPHQTWKYWQPRPDWEGSRSFVMALGGKLLAHGCAWPLPIHAPDRTWKAIYLIDWVADPAAPGVGVVLLRRMAELGDAICAIGGSDQTRVILPKIGFRPFNEIWFAARPLRLLRQAITHQHRDWKLPARVLRNAAGRLRPPLTAPGGWTSARCSPRDIPDHLWPRPDAELAVGARTAALFEYLTTSPWATFELHRITHQGTPAGYFCLAFAVGQARVADVWLPSRSADDWAAAYLLALEQARADSRAAEITAACSTPWGQEGLLRAGFRIIERLPITFRSSGAFPAGTSQFHLQMVDSDFAFLHTGTPEYRT